MMSESGKYKRRLRLAGTALVIALVGASGCGGGGGGGGSETRVSAVTPSDGATGVALDAIMTATFSTTLDCGALDPSMFTVQGPGGIAVAGSVACAGDTATFTPDRPLGEHEVFTARLSSGVKGVGGGGLTQQFQWTFTTRSRGWGAGGDIGTDTLSPRMAVDGTAHVHVSALCFDGTDMPPCVSTFGSGQWSEWVSVTPPVKAGPGAIAADASGNVVVVWNENASTGKGNIWMNRYAPGVGWGLAEAVESNDATDDSSPDVVMDDQGQVVVLWTRNAGPVTQLVARRYAAGAWGSESLLDSDAGALPLPQMAMGGDGSAFVVWQQSNGTALDAWGMRMAPDGSWGVAANLDSTLEDAYTPSVVVDRDGNATAVWHEASGAVYHVAARRYAFSKWQKALYLDSDNGREPKLAGNANGDVTVVWVHDGAADTELQLSRYSAAGGWGAVETLTDSPAAGAPRVALADSGDEVVVWIDGSSSVARAKRHKVGKEWSATVQVADRATSFSLAGGADGTVGITGLYVDGGGVSHVWANVFE